MAEGLSVAAANAVLDLVGSTYQFIKLHTGPPGPNFTANPAIETTRKQVTWGPAGGAQKANSADLIWTGVAGSEDYTHWSGWSALTGGSAGVSGQITANPLLSSDDFKIPAGGLVVSQPTAT